MIWAAINRGSMMRKTLAITAIAALSLTMTACSKKPQEAAPVVNDSAAIAAPDNAMDAVAENATVTGNTQSSNNQGSNDQGSNDQGSNDQGSNDQGDKAQ